MMAGIVEGGGRTSVMKQRVADALQILGAVGLTVATGFLFSAALALLVGSMLAVVAGVVLERT